MSTTANSSSHQAPRLSRRVKTSTTTPMMCDSASSIAFPCLPSSDPAKMMPAATKITDAGLARAALACRNENRRVIADAAVCVSR